MTCGYIDVKTYSCVYTYMGVGWLRCTLKDDISYLLPT